MTRIGLISDTHNYLDASVFKHFIDCNEIWHAGDFGNIGIARELAGGTGLIVKGVFGNIDGPDIRIVYPEKLLFFCEDIKVLIRHIGGYPGRYSPGVKKEIEQEKVQLFISGHSHILKIIFDPLLKCLHINPGAAGKQGWHTVRTIIRFTIDGKEIKDCEVIEL
ncbi:MAG TPA: metallophosphoesterase family protein [Ferruginibacter sp.]|nr:metallophosphoesterase family protein [Ferruginibacter sp.]